MVNHDHSSSPLKLSSIEVNSPCSTTPQLCLMVNPECFCCWLHLHFRWLHPGFHFQNKQFDFSVYIYIYIYIHFQNKHVHFQDLFFLESTSDQPLPCSSSKFWVQIPGTIFDAEQGSVALYQENHAAEVGRLQQAALLFLSKARDTDTLTGDLSNQKWANKHTVYIYI